MSPATAAAAGGPADLAETVALVRDVVTLERGGTPPGAGRPPLSADLLRHLRWHALLPAVTARADDLGFAAGDAQRLRSTRPAAAMASLRLAGSVARVHDTLEAQGIEAIHLKGVALSARTTGRLDGRISTDIDVLVAPEALAAADGAMRAAGYTPYGPRSHPGGGPHRRWAAISNHHLVYAHPASPTVELHWALSQPRLLDWSFAELWARRRTIDAGSMSLCALGDADELIHTAVHGCSHQFTRLAWLLDFARLARPMDARRWAEVLAAASDAGVLRPLALAAAMAARIDPRLAPVPLAAREGRVVDRLAQRAWRAMSRPPASRPTRRQSVEALFATMHLRPDLAYKVAAAAGSAVPLDQLEASRAPGVLSFVTVAMRPLAPRRFRRA